MADDDRCRRTVNKVAPRQAQALGEARARLLEDLYQASGRNEKSHAQHGTYTGLWEDLCLQAGRELMEYAMLNPGQAQITVAPKPKAPLPPLGSGMADIQAVQEARLGAFRDAAISIDLVRQAREMLSSPADLEKLQGAITLLKGARAYRGDYFLALSFTEGAPSFAALAEKLRREPTGVHAFPQVPGERGAEHEGW